MQKFKSTRIDSNAEVLKVILSTDRNIIKIQRKYGLEENPIDFAEN